MTAISARVTASARANCLLFHRIACQIHIDGRVTEDEVVRVTLQDRHGTVLLEGEVEEAPSRRSARLARGRPNDDPATPWGRPPGGRAA